MSSRTSIQKTDSTDVPSVWFYPHGERGSAEHLIGVADHPPIALSLDAGRQVGLHLVGRALGGALGPDALHPRVPESVDRSLGGLAEGVAIWPRLAYRGDGLGPSQAVEVGVGVQGVGAGVGATDIEAGVRLDRVIEAVSVVVLVLHQWRDARRIAVDGVGHAVAVRVGVRRRVEEGVGAGGADSADGGGAVARAVAVVVRVLDEAGGGGVARVVIAGRLVRQAVAVAVL